MTEQLVEQTCVPCRGGIPPLSIDEARQFLRQTPDWTLLDDGRLLQHTFRFANFRSSARISFVPPGNCRGRTSPSRHHFWLGLRHDLVADQKNQRSASERLHHGGEIRPPCTSERRSGTARRTAARIRGTGRRVRHIRRTPALVRHWLITGNKEARPWLTKTTSL